MTECSVIEKKSEEKTLTFKKQTKKHTIWCNQHKKIKEIFQVIVYQKSLLIIFSYNE